MKMKILIVLCIGFISFCQVNQLCSMSYAQACQHLGVNEDATQQEVEKVFDSKHAYYIKQYGEKGEATKVLCQAKGFLDNIFIARSYAQDDDSYEKEIVSSTYLSVFMKRIEYLESNTNGRWKNTIVVEKFDYYRIAIALGFLAVGATSLIYWHNKLGSFFNQKPKALPQSFYQTIVDKLPFFTAKK